jgi:hypothetical protein
MTPALSGIGVAIAGGHGNTVVGNVIRNNIPGGGVDGFSGRRRGHIRFQIPAPTRRRTTSSRAT